MNTEVGQASPNPVNSKVIHLQVRGFILQGILDYALYVIENTELFIVGNFNKQCDAKSVHSFDLYRLIIHCLCY